VPPLESAGHDVVYLDRSSPSTCTEQPAVPLRGSDALVIMAPPLPVGPATRSLRAWRSHDVSCSAGVQQLVDAARAAGVRRVVQQSFSFVYADQGADWVDEASPVCVTTATEPASEGELAVQAYTSTCRTGVVLRMGLVVGDSATTRATLRTAARGRPIGLGSAEGYTHLLHTDDVGPALLAALEVSSGVYNVGSDPVRRDVVVAAHARAAGRTNGGFVGPVSMLLGGRRLEPLARSLRVTSARFAGETGWAPRREHFDISWLDAAVPAAVAAR
jgi:nucleoside-diphosphate-sugar epimerase